MPAARVVECITALVLARELMIGRGGGGPRWSLARVSSLLDRARRALVLCKPWLPTVFYNKHRDMVADAASEAAAFAAARPGAADSLPAVSQDQIDESMALHAVVSIPTCAACGKQSLQLMKCAGCRAVSFW